MALNFPTLKLYSLKLFNLSSVCPVDFYVAYACIAVCTAFGDADPDVLCADGSDGGISDGRGVIRMSANRLLCLAVEAGFHYEVTVVQPGV